MLAEELGPQGVTVATVTIAGSITENTPLAPSRIACAFDAAVSSQTKAEMVFNGQDPKGFQLT